MGQMRSDLRNLITAQELYQTGNHAFAGNIDLLPTFKPIPGAHVEILTAGAQGWAAVESMPTNAGLGKSCVIWVGSIATGERPTTEAEHKTFPEAEVACDGDGLRQRAEWASAAQSYMTFALRKLAKSEEKYLALNGHDGRVVARAVRLGPGRVDRDRLGYGPGLGGKGPTRAFPAKLA